MVPTTSTVSAATSSAASPAAISPASTKKRKVAPVTANGTVAKATNQNESSPAAQSPAAMSASTITPARVAASWNFFKSIGSPKLHVAPMVDQSELPYRLLCRKYGADCAYTPMLHARLFIESEKYRREHFTTCPEDRPLITQFCANDPDILLQAAKYVENDCDAVDINFGCPQRIAKKGNYGAFLMDDLPRVKALVSILAENLSIPVFCKIRIFPDKERTLAYARMIQDAGCQLLAVHGRTRDQKRCREIRADWDMIKAVKEELEIPVLANGNVRHIGDALDCMAYTGCQGVLSAEPLLENPALFIEGREELVGEECCDLLLEYLDLVEQYPVPLRMVRAHVHRLLKRWFNVFPEVRIRMNESLASVDMFRAITKEIKLLVRQHLVDLEKAKTSAQAQAPQAEAARNGVNLADESKPDEAAAENQAE
mmetsp:Transcript_4843/g.12697  ORF Transcript_4843/g.12697 Transcript_4843/m.12697 type:complete len:428 (+) Transcript_4843:149-1432(+)|eukprot:CAMPEP_0198241216 /NCGR_PEP_ID=MMETSP1446-20131203/6077_1 /TAXON_ID=1461542 ORGANISM="Unidentified sp, Strain CCMP2111" /NCGR_SAMPLE_ID=MMETSP1446 /ASSEMBLY_ACC=CAM_ASM_001112 /LENGTH=427 /DNA_ID=CAMNT_0043924021 /DNA_START=74 /DNA_END=1357 /DNA_ORIENTATION=-